ncbi:MAG: hypothetical protein WBL41_09465, partial [Terracidiphilus sp.]
SLLPFEFCAYSSFGIGVHRKHTAKWHFHQENATFKRSQKVYVNSETALSAPIRTAHFVPGSA